MFVNPCEQMSLKRQRVCDPAFANAGVEDLELSLFSEAFP
jgi:hypothetical protein